MCNISPYTFHHRSVPIHFTISPFYHVNMGVYSLRHLAMFFHNIYVPIHFTISPSHHFTFSPLFHNFTAKIRKKCHQRSELLNCLAPVVQMKVIIRKVYVRIMERKSNKSRKRKRNMKWIYIKMKMKRRTNVTRKRDTERKIMRKCKRKWTQMKMKRRTIIIRNRETDMDMKINMRRRFQLVRRRDKERNSLRIHIRRKKKTNIRMYFQTYGWKNEEMQERESKRNTNMKRMGKETMNQKLMRTTFL